MQSITREYPEECLSEQEKYLQNFWNPKAGHQVVYQKKVFKIEKIFEKDKVDSPYSGAQALLKNIPQIVWLQDTAWKPDMANLDEIVTSLGGSLQKDCIMVKEPRGNVCYFKRPDNLEEYTEVIRQIRFFTHLHTQSKE